MHTGSKHFGRHAASMQRISEKPSRNTRRKDVRNRKSTHLLVQVIAARLAGHDGLLCCRCAVLLPIVQGMSQLGVQDVDRHHRDHTHVQQRPHLNIEQLKLNCCTPAGRRSRWHTLRPRVTGLAPDCRLRPANWASSAPSLLMRCCCRFGPCLRCRALSKYTAD